MKVGKDNSTEEKLESAIVLDSHTDSPVAGRVARVVRRTGRSVSVSGFTDKLGKAIRVPVVDAAVEYVCDKTGKTFIMLLRNALYVPEMIPCLLHPIMMRLVGVSVDECPKFLSSHPTEVNHLIYFEKEDIRIPLQLSGIISCLPCRYPGEREMEENDGILELTPDVDVWNPHDTIFQDQEEAMVDFSGNVKLSRPRNYIVSQVAVRYMNSDLLAEDVNDIFGISAVKFLNDESNMDPQQLSDAWGISEERARRTIRATTRLCNRNTSDITLSRRYPYNDRMIRYKHLNVSIFTDTMHASGRVGKSVRNYKYAQIFATSFGWVEVVLLEFERGHALGI